MIVISNTLANLNLEKLDYRIIQIKSPSETLKLENYNKIIV
jgi:hypothetical protein